MTLNPIFPQQHRLRLQLASSGPDGSKVLVIQAGQEHPYSQGRTYTHRLTRLSPQCSTRSTSRTPPIVSSCTRA